MGEWDSGEGMKPGGTVWSGRWGRKGRRGGEKLGTNEGVAAET